MKYGNDCGLLSIELRKTFLYPCEIMSLSVYGSFPPDVVSKHSRGQSNETKLNAAYLRLGNTDRIRVAVVPLVASSR